MRWTPRRYAAAQLFGLVGIPLTSARTNIRNIGGEEKEGGSREKERDREEGNRETNKRKRETERTRKRTIGRVKKRDRGRRRIWKAETARHSCFLRLRIMAPVSSSGNKKLSSWKDLVNGGVLQCLEAATLGMPFEVWKTRMGRFRHESTKEAFVSIYRRGGVGSFWQGLGPKLVESATKGSVLLFCKEAIFDAMVAAEVRETPSGLVAGAGAGVCQTIVMGPCTFLVTVAVTGTDQAKPLTATIQRVWRSQGLRGFYPGGTAIAFRQATNWASRQGITEGLRDLMRRFGNKRKLSIAEEVSAGILGGMLSTWNQPFEVARIHMQSAANEGKPKQNIVQALRHVITTDGPQGLFKGIIPRMGLGIWQTLFMVTGAKMVKERLPW